MSILRRLSQTLGQIRKGYAVDTYQGGFPVVQIVKAPDTASATAVHAAVTLTTAVQDVTTGITHPDIYRAVSVKGSAATVYGSVTILGRDWAGQKQTEVIIASGTGAIEGNKAFKYVDKITLPVRVAPGETISVGSTTKLGLYRPISAAALDLLEVDGVVEAAAAIDTSNGTFTPTTAPNGTRNFRASYLTEIF